MTPPAATDAAPHRSLPGARLLPLVLVLVALGACSNAAGNVVDTIFGSPVRITAAPTPLADLTDPTPGYTYPSFKNADGTYTRILWLPVGMPKSLQSALGGQPAWDAVKPAGSAGKVLEDLNAPNNTAVKSWAKQAGTETLTMRGPLDAIDQCTELIEYYLSSIPQILIEARVVEVLETDEFGFGLDWFGLEIDDHDPANLSNPRTSALDPSSTIFDRGTIGRGIPPLPGVIRGEIIPNVLLELGTIVDNVQIDLLISALQQFTKVDVVNAPNVRVRTGHVAQILSGEDVPFFSLNVSGSNTTVSTKFREVGVKLNILPSLLTPQLIQLAVDLRVENITGISSVVSGGANTSNPIISSRAVTTTMSVKNGSTVVLGGLITTQSFEVQDRVPILGDVPILAPLFTNRQREGGRSNLLFLIRPTLMPSPLDRSSRVIEPPRAGEVLTPPGDDLITPPPAGAGEGGG